MLDEHPLHRSWSMYYDSGRGMQNKQDQKGRHSWKAYSKICTFNTVESFWRVFNNLVKVDQLDGKKDFFLFEDGIEPDWDDPGNAHGGLWLVHCNECLKADLADGKPAADASLDNLWRDAVYHTVGEQFPHSTEVVGVALNLRKTGARLALWTRGSEGEEGLRAIGRAFRTVVHLPASKSAGYARHAVSKKQQAGQFYWSGFQGQMTV